jgi:hypothetical protein
MIAAVVSSRAAEGDGDRPAPSEIEDEWRSFDPTSLGKIVACFFSRRMRRGRCVLRKRHGGRADGKLGFIVRFDMDNDAHRRDFRPQRFLYAIAYDMARAD